MNSDDANYVPEHPVVPELSEEQAEAYRGILDNLQTGCPIALMGAAGVGKSFLTRYVVRALAKTGEVLATGLTHKACNVLRAGGLPIPVTTLHSALGLRAYKDHATGEETFKPMGEPKLPYGGTLIVDESSMVNEELLDLTLSTAENYDCAVLFVGDAYQLPPVGEGTAPVFERDDFLRIELTEIQRQAAGNPLIMAAHQYRRALLGEPMDPKHLKPRLNEDGVGFVLKDKAGLVDTMSRLYTESDDVDHVRMVAFTNKQVQLVNRFVRGKVFGKPDTPPFEAGELAVVNSAVTRYDPQTRQDEVVLMTDSLVEVVGITRGTRGDIEFGGGIAGWDVTVANPEGARHLLFLPDDPATVKRELNALSRKAKSAPPAVRGACWRDFFALKNGVHDLRHPYALTCHKSQGSTYEHVLVHVPDIVDKATWAGGQAFAARLLYVALTRASQVAYINAPLPVFNAARVAA